MATFHWKIPLAILLGALVLSDNVQVFDWTIPAAMEEFGQASRTLHLLEVFAGTSQIAKAAKAHGLQSQAFDICLNPMDNLLTKSGFTRLLEVVFALVVGGLCFLAPVCSSFVFCNSSRTKRTKANPDGNQSYKRNKEGSIFLTICLFVEELCSLRGVHWAIENPLSSLINSTSLWSQHFMKRSKPIFQTKLCMCRFSRGARAKKPLKLFADGNWIAAMGLWCTCRPAQHIQLMKKKGNQVNPTPLLKKSQAYTKMFGRSVVRCWLEQSDGVLWHEDPWAHAGTDDEVASAAGEVHDGDATWAAMDTDDDLEVASGAMADVDTEDVDTDVEATWAMWPEMNADERGWGSADTDDEL